MNDKSFEIKIDDRVVSVRPGQMLIEAMDELQIDVPRFCYHPRLSVAANCRMCMVEVEKSPKPLPACATPVMPNMAVRSNSELAMEGQKGTMEMLLINHPLDCPICDQGGECELQDVSMAHGQSHSRYAEAKRVVNDEDIGPLISTDMTRCISCTRCVRFGVEIAGVQELGMTGRSEHVKIGTYVKRSVSSEMSGNMIDICPVGALNSKPFRMSARAWELERCPQIANHDCLGSQTYAHTLRNKVKRIVPAECEEINYSWLSDRDRFSYSALDHPDRLLQPSILDNVTKRHSEVDWFRAISEVAGIVDEAIRYKETHKIGVFIGANSSLEEMHALTTFLRRLGIHNIDHRLRQSDFSYQDEMPVAPWFGESLTELDRADSILLVGADVRKQQPVLATRIRLAALKGAKVSTINLYREDLNFPVDTQLFGGPENIFSDLLSVYRHLVRSNKSFPATQKMISAWTEKFIVKPQAIHQRLADSLLNARHAKVIVGSGAFTLPNFAAIRAIASAIAEMTDSSFGFLTENSNTMGAWYSGCLPHRGGVHDKLMYSGLNAAEMAQEALATYIFFNCEPERDHQLSARMVENIKNANHVININSFAHPDTRNEITVHLPLASSFEKPGTYINAVGRWQYQIAGIPPRGQSLPGWKIISMLARALGLDQLEYRSSDELSEEVERLYRSIKVDVNFNARAQVLSRSPVKLQRLSRLSNYHGDSMQRRATPLQQTVDAGLDRLIWMSPVDAEQREIQHGDWVRMVQDAQEVRTQALLTDAVAPGTVVTSMGTDHDSVLKQLFQDVEISRVSEQNSPA